MDRESSERTLWGRSEKQKQNENQVRQFLERFEGDHALLRSLFCEEIRKSGGDERKTEKVNSEKYFLSHTLTEATAEHLSFPSALRLSVPVLKDSLESGNVTDAIYALIHEWCHDVATRIITSGYGTFWRGNNPFNEGVTSMIGDELFLAYARNHNNFGITQSMAEAAISRRQDGYSGSRLVVGVFRNTVAKRTDVTPDVVWRAMKKHYFTDGFSREVRSAIKELFDGEFVHKLVSMPRAKGQITTEPSFGALEGLFEKYFDQPENQDIIKKLF